MKIIKTAILSILFMSAFVSCNKNSKIDPSNAASVLKDGTWKVTLFKDDNQDETNYFQGYSFIFGDGGVVTATSSTQTVNGTWITLKDSGKTKLDLNFDDVFNFDELDEDWEIISQTATKIELKDGSGLSTDYLTFEKN